MSKEVSMSYNADELLSLANQFEDLAKGKKSSLKEMLQRHAETASLPPAPPPAWTGVQNNEYAARTAIQNLQRTLSSLQAKLPQQGDTANYRLLQVLNQIAGLLQKADTATPNA
jgi:hypothetical protein